MNKEKQRIAIAEACGWDTDPHEAHDWGSRGQWCVCPGDENRTLVSKTMELPDYLNDLNAMHEAEDSITPELEGEYWKNLCALNLGKRVYHYTAAQRAEAFLKTIGKWED